MPDLFTHAGLARSATVILLDYQCTLVANGAGRREWFARNGGRLPFADWIGQEVYREWLLPLFRGRRVVLVTSRDARYEDATMARIREVLDWQPDEWHFNAWGLRPDLCKRRVLLETVVPRHGTPAVTAYLALESNAVTRAMYAREGIYAVRVPDSGAWHDLPLVSPV